MGVLNNPVSAVVLALLAGKVSKGEVAIRVADYSPAADGLADDSAKIQSAANDSAGKLTLIFDGSKRYNINAGVVFPAGTRLQTNGCTFVKTVNNNTYVIRTSDRFSADRLNLEITGGAAAEAGIYVNGNDTIIERINVTSLNADQMGANALLVGDLSAQKTNIRINAVTLSGFRSPMRVINVTESRFSNARISNFLTGVYVVNTTDTTFDKFKITGTSTAGTGSPGQNGLLLEAWNGDYGCINLRFRDWVVEGASEHAYRIGGALSVADVTFQDCIARTPGNASGNVATGGSGFKVLGAVGHLHQNIRFENCASEDGNVNAAGINNFAHFHIGLVDGCTLINPTGRAKNNTYSNQIGLLIFASKNVDVVAPRIRDTNRQALYLFKDSTEPSPAVGLAGIRIRGGLFDTSNANNVVLFDAQSAVIKDVFLDDVELSRGSQAFRVATPTTSGTDTGAYSNVNVRIRYVDAPTGSTTPPITGGNLTVNHYEGPIYGSSSIPSLDGGSYMNTSTGSRYIRKSASWVLM